MWSFQLELQHAKTFPSRLSMLRLIAQNWNSVWSEQRMYSEKVEKSNVGLVDIFLILKTMGETFKIRKLYERNPEDSKFQSS
jgi:hypothetical protein